MSLFRPITSRIAIVTVAITFAAASSYAAKPKQRNIDKVKQEQQTVKKQLKETSKAITVNTRETEKNLNRLSRLDADMKESRVRINLISEGIDSITGAIALRNDSIKALEGRIDDMKKAYADALRRAQPYRGSNSLISYIFSAESVRQAYRRMRYLRQFSSWRERKTDEISGAVNELAERREMLLSMEKERREQLSGLSREQKTLEKQQQETSALVAKLKSEGENLRKTLKQREERARALDRELDRLIAEEQARIERERKAREKAEREKAEKAAKEKAAKEKAAKEKAAKSQGSKDKAAVSNKTQQSGQAQSGKPVAQPKPQPAKTEKPALTAEATAARTLNGSFEANKGRLLFPVAGKYRVVRTFGRQKHPELQHVETNNSGIDIEVNAGTDARAIFEGKVSGIFRMPGYENIVMVRHGDYISLYANLQQIFVKTGDSVKTGQAIGKIFTDPDDDGRTTFHFELRRERTKLNPLEWVR